MIKVAREEKKRIVEVYMNELDRLLDAESVTEEKIAKAEELRDAFLLFLVKTDFRKRTIKALKDLSDVMMEYAR